jgi:hypothetical protein
MRNSMASMRTSTTSADAELQKSELSLVVNSEKADEASNLVSPWTMPTPPNPRSSKQPMTELLVSDVSPRQTQVADVVEVSDVKTRGTRQPLAVEVLVPDEKSLPSQSDLVSPTTGNNHASKPDAIAAPVYLPGALRPMSHKSVRTRTHEKPERYDETSSKLATSYAEFERGLNDLIGNLRTSFVGMTEDLTSKASVKGQATKGSTGATEDLVQPSETDEDAGHPGTDSFLLKVENDLRRVGWAWQDLMTAYSKLRGSAQGSKSRPGTAHTGVMSIAD